MDASAFGKRNALANARMMQAAGHIANITGLPLPALTGVSRDPQYAALFEREAVASFLEDLEDYLQQPELAAAPEPDKAEVQEPEKRGRGRPPGKAVK